MANQETTLSVKITADLSQFSKALDKAVSNVAKMGQKMQDVGKKMSTFISLPLAAAGGVAVQQAVKFEKLATSLNVLTGSAEAGAAAFERIKQFSASTPFQLDELVTVNNQLMGFGMNADQAFKSLQMLGDVASVSGADLGRVAVAFGQSAAAGRVMTQDLNQFVNNGIPIYQLLGDVTGKNVGELRDLAAQGGITFELLNQAFARATSEGGKFFQGTAQLSQTLGGRLSTLRDNFNLMMGEFGQLIGEFLSPLIKVATNLFQVFGQLDANTKKVIVVVAGLAAAIGPLLIAFGTIAQLLPVIVSGFAVLTSPITLVTGAILGVAAAVIYLSDNWQAVKDRITDLSWWRNALIDMIQWFIEYNPFQLMIDGANKVLEFFGKNPIESPFEMLVEKLEGLKVETNGTKKEFGSFGDALTNTLTKLGLIKKAVEDTDDSIQNLGTTVNTVGGGKSNDEPLFGDIIDIGDVGAESRKEMADLDEAMSLAAEKSKMYSDTMAQGFNRIGQSAVSGLGEATTAGGRFLRELARQAIELISVNLAQSLSNSITGATAAGASTGPASPFTTPAFIASAIGGVMAAFAALPKFATGGIVSGSSYSGDQVLARVNSGEMILNGAQQRNLFDIANGRGGSRQVLEARIKGADIWLSNTRAGKERRRYTGR